MFNIKRIPNIINNQVIQKRFWSKINIMSVNDCWNWDACLCRGYGQFGITENNKTKLFPAHRIAFYFKNKIDPMDKLVCHRCDNPRCCNPTHLFLGSARDNAIDCVLKGRTAVGDRNGSIIHPERILRGSKHPRAKLNEDLVKHIRSLYKGKDFGYKRIAKMLDLKPSTVGNVVHNSKNHWKHI